MSQEIDIIATNARPIGPNMTYVREETITVSEPLTDAERLEYGQEMADALAKIEEYEAALDAERKHYKRLIETQEKIAQTASKHYRDGKEEREVHCDLLKDWDKCEMVWVESTEPYREILRRPMTAEERQGSFLEKPLAAPSADDDDVIDMDAEEQQ